MGITYSKLLKHDPKSSKVNAAIQTETPKEKTIIQDIRSPTADIVRTPIILEKFKSKMDSPVEYQSFPLRNKLKNLKLDPRSPTIGIYRTPIFIEGTPSNKTTPDNSDSPISIYSSNANDFSIEDIMTPIEPSANVSGFEVPKEIYCGEFDVTIREDEDTEGNDENKSCLKVSEQPNTYEAKKLLEEIISDEENFLRKVKTPSRRVKRCGIKNLEKNIIQIKGKFRSPLSNITSSSNSPGNIKSGMRLYNQNKVVPEFGSENSAISNTKHLAQWDQNNTVII